jgi:RecG-like helicase
VLVEDGAGAALELVYFNADPAYLKRLLPIGSKRLISGKLEAYDGWLQMPHPDHVAPADANGGAALPLHEPVYPLTAGLTNNVLRKAVGEALNLVPSLPEWIDAELLTRNTWPNFGEAIAKLHAPEGEADLLPSTAARARLAYDELLANQLALAVIRARLKRPGGGLPAPARSAKPFSTPCPSLLRARSAAHLPRSMRTWRANIACCGCCKATSAAARRWWHCSPWQAPWKPARRRP